MIFKIKEINIEGLQKDPNPLKPHDHQHHPKQAVPKAQRFCRYCLDNSSSYDNPLIYPCFCAGTTKYVHF